MSEFVTTGSNNTISGTTVSVKIRVSKNDASKINFGNKTKITISKIDELVVKKEGSIPVNYKDDIATNTVKLNFNESSKTYTIIVNEKELSYFELEIYGELNKDFKFDDSLKININFNNDVSNQEIDFKLVNTQKPIKIVSFQANANIIQKNRGNLILIFSFEGNPEKVSLFENGKLLTDNLVNKQKVENLFQDKQPGIYEYTLQASKGEQLHSRSETIVYVDESKVTSRIKPVDATIINFSAAQNGDYLFALTYNDNKELLLHYTNQIDGNNWQKIHIDNLEKIKPFINSPMLHLQSSQEINEGKLGRILFIGGSRIENTANSIENGNQVAIIELNGKETQIVVHEIEKWQPRWGHSCIIFPKKEHQNTIWMLGGEDEYGNVTNEVWTSTDGIKWTKENEVNWDKRTMHSACVSYQIENNVKTKDAIYLGGGFKSMGDQYISDIWKYDKNSKWEKIISNQFDTKTKAFGLGYGGIENIGDVGIYSMTAKNQINLNSLIIDNQNKFSLKEINSANLNFNTFNQGIVTTAFFKECVWFMTINSLGSTGITYSNLFYRIPTIHQTTIDFYSNPKNNK